MARIRQELRERLMSDRHADAGEVLARLRNMAERHVGLTDEYERWRIRFELLAKTASA